jgi:endonuclease-8
MTRMRVHLGSDHAGLELKAHLAGWLSDHGYEPVDHGPFEYDAVDDYPVFCLRAAEGVAIDRKDGLDSCGVVIGGSGNGEQMAANKVPGIRCALAWSEETASLARQHNDAQVVAVGGRMHPVEDMTRFVEVFLTTPFSQTNRDGSRMPEGHTLHRLATALDDAFAGHPVRVSSPQGRFAESAALLDGRTVETAESWGKHLWVHFAHDDLVHVHLGLYGRFDVLRDAESVPAPVGQVRLRLVRADVTTASYADLRGATACALQTSEQREALVARLGPDPLRPDADPDLAWHRIKRSRAPIAGLLMDQSVIAGIGNVYRAELLFRHRIDPFRAGTSLRVGRWRELWDDLVVLMADGVRTGRIDTVRSEHLTDEERGASEPRRGHSYVYRRAGDPCRVCGTRVRTREMLGRNLYWCAKCQPRFRSRVVK